MRKPDTIGTNKMLTQEQMKNSLAASLIIGSLDTVVTMLDGIEYVYSLEDLTGLFGLDKFIYEKELDDIKELIVNFHKKLHEKTTSLIAKYNKDFLNVVCNEK